MDRSPNQSLSFVRVLVALAIALLGSVVIWVAVPYNNFWLDNSYLADSYLPEVVIGLLMIIVLALNPVFRLIGGPKCMLNHRQLAIIGAMLLFAAIIPSNGLMRMFPRLVAEINWGLNSNPTHAEIAADAGFPQALFPDPLPIRDADGNVKTFPTPVSDQFLDELEEGASIPWGKWIPVFAAWGMLLIALWAMMIGLAGIVYPQWRERERLPFPLLNLYHALIGAPEKGEEPSTRALPPLFYNMGFWVAVLTVFLIHGFRGLHVFTDAFPSFPLDWNLGEYFTDSVLRHAAYPLKRQSILFAIVGITYFVPNRYAVSVWGWVFFYAWYLTFGQAYIPAFSSGQVGDQAFGMLLAIAVWVLWLGKDHWRQVGRAMLGGGDGGGESQRDRIAGWTFAIGCAGITCWLVWVGCGVWWSIMTTAIIALIALLMARIISETGVPVLWLSRFQIQSFQGFLPTSAISPATLLFTGVLYALVTRATAVNVAVMSTLAIGMDKEANASQQARIMGGGMIVLVIGFIVCGGVHLTMGYSSADIMTNPKTGSRSLAPWPRYESGRANHDILTAGTAHRVGGFGVGAGLLWACSRYPSWPVHPVGILFCRNSVGHLLWFSIFLGWLIKVTVTGLFGGGAYRKARPVFVGLILGELLAVIVWTLVPVIIIITTGVDPSEIPRYTIFKYP